MILLPLSPHVSSYFTPCHNPSCSLFPHHVPPLLTMPHPLLPSSHPMFLPHPIPHLMILPCDKVTSYTSKWSPLVLYAGCLILYWLVCPFLPSGWIWPLRSEFEPRCLVICIAVIACCVVTAIVVDIQWLYVHCTVLIYPCHFIFLCHWIACSLLLCWHK